MPSDNFVSLKSFCDEMETNIRALEALGKSQDTFGDLLVPIILGKLPDETKINKSEIYRINYIQYLEYSKKDSSVITYIT